MIDWIRQFFTQKNRLYTGNLGSNDIISVEPDRPCPFGYKTVWYVIKNESPQSVIDKLQLTIIAEANWKTGLDLCCKKNRIFVSPCLGGYIAIIGFLNITKNVVKTHANLFEELQYYANHRIVELYGWAKFRHGELLHAYEFCGERGEILWNEGLLTAEELELGFDQFEMNFSTEGTAYPGEEDVLNIAKLWGIDPTFENQEFKKSTGFLCTMSNTHHLKEMDL